MQYYTYVIGPKESILLNSFENCYIGVTINLEKRWKAHSISEYTVGYSIRDNDWVFNENMKPIFIGSEDDCYLLEYSLRPLPFMGLNEAIGGHGGYTSYTEERNLKISKALKGRRNTWSHKASKTKIENGIAAGSKNPNAKKWKVIDSDGNEHEIHGNIAKFCNEHCISSTALISAKGEKVEPPNLRYYRDNGNAEHRARRMNTIGWSVRSI